MASEFSWVGKSIDGETVVLRKFSGQFPLPTYVNAEWIAANPEKIKTGVVIDVETTGLNKKTDTVIEIGLRQFKFNRANGDLIDPGKTYSGFQDPGKPLSEEIKRLTGLNDDLLRGKSIDWLKVDAMLSEANIIFAHNAAFDRPFVEKNARASQDKPWGCSLKQIDWTTKGYGIHKLEILCIYHGFFADAHRALSDAEALLYLLTMTDRTSRKPYMNELLINARRPMVRMAAKNSPFESKDHLKERGYSWDANNRYWFKTIYKDHLTDELAWMETVIYNGAYRGSAEEIPITDNFKA
jgi:DNA polymerase-3 subunit epsilon